MRWIFSLLIFITTYLGAQTPDSTHRLLHRISNSFQQVAVDPLFQAYGVDSEESLIKYDPTGKLQFRFDNSTLGPIGSVDVSNPFNLLLFYPQFQTVVLLDRTLNERSRLDLRQLTDLQNPVRVARSFNDNIWVYDDWTFRLTQIDPSGQVLHESDDLRLLLQIESPPASIYAEEAQVFLHFPKRGLAVFSNVGQFRRWIDLPAADGGSWSRHAFVVRAADQWYYTDLQQAPIPLPFPPEANKWRQVVILANRLYIQDSEGLFVWERR